MRRTSRLAIPLALLLAAPAGALVPATPAGAQVPPPVRLLPTPPGPLVAAGVPVPPNPATRPVAAAALQPWAEDQLGFGRLVFPEPRHGHYTVTQDGERLVVGHDPGQPLADVTPKPRNVSAILNGPSTTAITAQPGAKFRTRRSGGNLVIEVLDPPPAAPPAHLLPRLARSGPGHKPMERPTVTAAAPPPPSVARPSVAPIDPVQAKPLAPPAPPPPARRRGRPARR